MKLFKKTSIFFASAMILSGLVGCTNADKDIVDEAIVSVNIIGEYKMTTAQLNLIGQVTTTIKEETIILPVVWTADDSARWEFSEMDSNKLIHGNPKFPDLSKDEENVNFTLTATLTYNKAKATKKFSGVIVAKEPDKYITIAEAKTADEDTEVQIKGVISDAHSGSGFFVTDTTGTLYVYTATTAPIYTSGSTVVVTGTKTKNNKTIKDSTGVEIPPAVEVAQLKYVSMEITDTSTTAISRTAAQTKTVDEVLAWGTDPSSESFVNHSNELLVVRGTVFEYVAATYSTWELINAQSKYLAFYVNSGNTAVNDAFRGFVSPKKDKLVDALLAVMDISTSSSNRTTWRCVPLEFTEVTA